MFEGAMGFNHTQRMADYGARRTLGTGGSVLGYIQTGNGYDKRYFNKTQTDRFESQRKKAKAKKTWKTIGIVAGAIALAAGAIALFKGGKNSNFSKITSKIKSKLGTKGTATVAEGAQEAIDTAQEKSKKGLKNLFSKFGKKSVQQAAIEGTEAIDTTSKKGLFSRLKDWGKGKKIPKPETIQATEAGAQAAEGLAEDISAAAQPLKNLSAKKKVRALKEKGELKHYGKVPNSNSTKFKIKTGEVQSLSQEAIDETLLRAQSAGTPQLTLTPDIGQVDTKSLKETLEKIQLAAQEGERIAQSAPELTKEQLEAVTQLANKMIEEGKGFESLSAEERNIFNLIFGQ